MANELVLSFSALKKCAKVQSNPLIFSKVIVHSSMEGVKKRGLGRRGRQSSFIGVHSSLDGVKNGVFYRGGGIPPFIGVHSSLKGVKKRGLLSIKKKFMPTNQSHIPEIF